VEVDDAAHDAVVMSHVVGVDDKLLHPSPS
jgi:hypothetical protein